jgi:hypothetical protein
MEVVVRVVLKNMLSGGMRQFCEKSQFSGFDKRSLFRGFWAVARVALEGDRLGGC